VERTTSDADAIALARRVADAHGATLADANTAAVRLHLSAGGPAFRLKGQGDAFADMHATVRLGVQTVRFQGTDWRAEVGGQELVERYRNLNRGRRRLRWTRDDAATFGGAALWTYTNLPFLLTTDRLTMSYGGLHTERGERWQVLKLEFPTDVATHSPRQSVYVDDDGMIRRHDYVARAFGRWVLSAHYLEDFKDFGGITLATRRHVHPRLGGRSVRRPTVVAIRVHDAELVRWDAPCV
jgi:hypothetical protein